MKREKKVEKVLATADVVEPTVEKVVPVEETPVKKEDKVIETRISASVIGRNGGVVRVYSKEEHGKDFMVLAKGFAAKKGLRVL